ncbi:AAA family ATPase [Streptomyces sp. NPDC050507]|uniref:AAA family ATPase n=1 Tax=Streptomyces sp. NPDC050507 TaxID=3365619 RepID=UPI0037B690BE
MTITLVAGPPCAGKNRYVAEHKRPGDLVVDFDALIQALGGAGDHDQPDALKRYTYEARDAVVSRLMARRDVDAWVILSAPDKRARETYMRRSCRTVLVLASEAVCLERARAERPPEWQDYVRNWFTRYEAALWDDVHWTG